MKAFVTIVCCLFAAGCGGSGGATGPSSSVRWYSGVWVGSITHPQGGAAGTLHMAIDARDDGFFTFGTWDASFPQATFNDHGSLMITVGQTPESLGMILTSARTCPGAATATLFVSSTAIDGRLTGAYEERVCGGAILRGTIDLRKQ